MSLTPTRSNRSNRSTCSRWQRAAAGLILGCASLAHGPSAHAQGPSETDLAAARALFAQGVADEEAGQWSTALEKIRRASTVKMTSGLRFHIALCEEKTGHLVAALADYTAAQAAARVEPNVEVLRLVSEPMLALKLRMPTVTVRLPDGVSPIDPQTEVRLDGAVLPAPSVGAPLPLDVGTHTVQVKASARLPYAMTFTVVERQAATVDVRMKPMPGTTLPGAASARVSPGAPSGVTIETTPPASSAPALPEASSHPRGAAIATSVGAVALIGFGVASYAIAGSDQSSWVTACKTQPSPCGNATPVRAWDATALTAWIAGGGLGVVSAILWSRGSDASSTKAAALELRAGPGSIGVSGSF